MNEINETFPDNKVETRVPVNEYQQVENDFRNPESIGRTCPSFCLVEEVHHPVDPEDPVEPQYDGAGDLLVAAGAEQKVSKVRGEDAEKVQDVGGVPQGKVHLILYCNLMG